MPAPDVSLFFPVYNDEATVRAVAERALQVFRGYADRFEIVIVDDGSPDRSGQICDELAHEYPDVIRVIHHQQNLGYGAAIRSGLAACNYDWICMIDGDNEYDVADLRKMLSLREFYSLIIAFRYKKLYSAKRIFVSFVYNAVLRMLFRTPFRDVSTGLRVLHRSILDDIHLTCNSPFIGAELAIKTMLRGYPVGQLGIQTFPRTFGRGSSTTAKNIWLTMRDMVRVRHEIFSPNYDLPEGRIRDPRSRNART
jgi:glycosyltransferase involved in cell wall biosynthesis